MSVNAQRSTVLTRRRWLAASALTLGSLAAGTAFAQDYPAKPVRMIVPYAAGGATDILARLLGTRLDQVLKQSFVIDLVSVPYRGAGPSIADFIAGQVQMTFATVSSILDHVRGGRARALAIIGERSPLLPDVPTMVEAGLPGIDAALMFGLVAPSATPAAIVSRLAEATANSVRTDPLHARLAELGYVAIGSRPDEFRARLETDIAKWARVIEAGNIRPN